MKRYIVVIFLCISSSLFAQQIELIPYRSQNLWGYATSNRQIAITPEYDSVTFFNTYGDSKNVFAYVFKQNKVGLIDITGKLVIPLYAKNIEILSISGIGYCNRILVNVVNKYGIVDFKNQIVIPFQYDTIIPKARYVETPFGPEFSKDSKITILSPDGKIILPLLYNSYESWDSWSIITKDNGKLGYFSYNEGIDIKPKYDFIKRYRDVWYVTLDGKSYYIDKYGFKYCSD